MGTIPQWICAVALVSILTILATHWSGFSPEWVTAIATTILAFAALLGFIGVLIPLQLERHRRRSLHLEKLIALVLQPIGRELESYYEPRLTRRYTPLEWLQGHGFRIAPRKNFADSILYESKTNDEADLYDPIYNDIKENHYPQLIAEYERARKDYEGLANLALTEAESIKTELHKAAVFNSRDDKPNENGLYFGHLAFYIFNNRWLQNHTYPLSVLIQNPGFAVLYCEGTSQHFGYGSEQDMETAKIIVDSLIENHGPLESMSIADDLAQRVHNLQDAISNIRVNGLLIGDCPATNSRNFLS